MINKSQAIRDSCSWVHSQSTHVQINQEKIGKLISDLQFPPLSNFIPGELPQHDEYILLYLFLLDSMNFCYWPLEKFQFIDLSRGLLQFMQKVSSQKELIEGNGATSLILQHITTMTAGDVRKQIFCSQNLCLMEERTQIIKDSALTIIHQFQGSLVKMIASAQRSAVKLLDILTKHFLNFQDHAIFKGRQVHFYKRSQLLIRHIYGFYEGKGLGEFSDIAEITIFPDYRLPQVFNHYGILEYSEQLQEKVNKKIQIESGSTHQIQIRACTVIAADIIKSELEKEQKRSITSVELDWYLWNFGESNLQSLGPHHRTLTIYY